MKMSLRKRENVINEFKDLDLYKFKRIFLKEMIHCLFCYNKNQKYIGGFNKE
jgi:hypothetical protein